MSSGNNQRPFSDDDRAELERRGISEDDAMWQAEVLRRGAQPASLVRSATVGDGVERLGSEDIARYTSIAEQVARRSRVSKFVPASGAASRMFKEIMEERERGVEGVATQRLLDNLGRFAFIDITGRSRRETLDRLLVGERGVIALPDTPKGLLGFHKYEGETRTAFAEQLYEAAKYVTDAERVCRVHFTVAADAREAFEQHLEEIRPKLESRTGARFEVTFSIQHPSTDTLAIADDGSVFRREDGTILFRPGGHGALLRNLEETRGDLVVVKNIDNVVPEHAMDIVVKWKKILIGCAASLQERVADLVMRCRSGGERQIEEARSFARLRFGREVPAGTSGEALRAAVAASLDRPLRVIGVVRNEGEPGGAPFWTRSSDGVSLQIVESAQVDHGNDEQEKIWRSATHFNPVDIICSLRSADGKPHRLRDFVDDEAVFISNKSYGGANLKALELPGLWNGAMAGWNTVAIEVPSATFAPVKTVFDLLRSEHQ